MTSTSTLVDEPGLPPQVILIFDPLTAVLTELACDSPLDDQLADEAVGAVVLSTSTTLNDDVRAIVGLLCGRDATQITPAAPSDHDWMTQCARLRDVQAALRDRISDAPDLIDAQSAGLVGLLLGLAARGTPCVFVGAAAHAAAVVAQRQSLAAAFQFCVLLLSLKRA